MQNPGGNVRRDGQDHIINLSDFIDKIEPIPRNAIFNRNQLLFDFYVLCVLLVLTVRRVLNEPYLLMGR